MIRPRSTRQKGWEYCTVCGEGRDLRGNKARKTGMCITCLRANPPELTAPYLCTLCGDTEPSHFAKKGRARCTTCINKVHSDWAKVERRQLNAIFAALTACDEGVGGCGLKDSHVVDGLCAVCREEMRRGRRWVFDKDDLERWLAHVAKLEQCARVAVAA
jgi:CRISPR/Cas system-associated protein Cas10 (large subunit of type III CRISPR-Cas system)